MFLVSCDSKHIFDEYNSIPEAFWDKKKEVSFNFMVNDTVSKQNLFINLRNNNSFSFSNLFLITKLDFPEGQIIIDTLEYDMADRTGKFLGTGFSEIKENKLFYKENIIFPNTGNYTINITHAMRKSDEVPQLKTIVGITDIGFRIEKTK